MKLAIVTGGSSGIGEQVVEKLRARGWKVEVFSRRTGVDVTDKDAVNAALERILTENGGRIDALINNAGCGIFGAAETTSEEEIRRQFEINYFAVVGLTQKVLSVMRKQGGGNIVNVASCAAYFPLPFQSFYSATKAALEAWTRAVSGEVAPFGVRMTVVCPGDVKTAFTSARRVQKEESAYSEAEKKALDKAAKSEQSGMAPTAIAEEIVEFVEAKRLPLVAIPGWQYAWLDRLARLMPRTWVSKLIARFYI